MRTRMLSLFALAATLAFTGTARAAVFNVNSTADAVDLVPGNGVCLTATGVCTLRAAVQEANNFPGADTINLPAGNYVLTIPGGGENASATGDLDVIRDLAILGAGRDVTFIDGNNGVGFNDGVIDVLGTPMVNISLTLRDLTVRNGRDVGLEGGGGINVGDGSLTMRDAAVRDCETQASGGGIDYTSANTLGTLVLDNTEITGNDALTSVVSALPGGGGGVAIGGGFATATLTNVLVSANTVGGGQGGGVLVWTSATATLTDVTIDRNVTTGEAEPPFDRSMGGGLAVWTANAILDGVTVSRNTAHAGGGIGALDGSLVMDNVTISGNMAVPIAIAPVLPAIGGGIGAIMEPGFSVTMRGANWTIAENSADQGGAIGAVVGVPADFQAFVANTILATNAPANCQALAPMPAIVSFDFNLDDDASCGFAQAGDLSGVGAVLGPLASNGGPTETHAVIAGSPAIDWVTAPTVACPNTDQRGVARPQDGDSNGSAICDIGAYERQPMPGCAPVGSARGPWSAVGALYVTALASIFVAGLARRTGPRGATAPRS